MNRLKNPIWIALIVFVVNMVVRLLHADAYFPQGDEPFTVYFAQWPIADIYKIVSTSNNPPTFEIILHGWMKIFGVNAFGLRLLPTILISLAAMSVALIAGKSGGYRLAIWSSVLFLFTNFQMDFAHTLRAYSLLICSSCWSMYFFIISSEKQSRNTSIGWIITSFLTVASHYFGWFILLVQWVSIIAFKRQSKTTLKSFLINNAVVFVLYLPLLFVMLKRYFATLDEGTFLSPTINLQPIYQIGLYAFNNDSLIVLLVGLLMVAGSMFMIWKTSISKSIKILLIILVPVSALPFVSYLPFIESFFNWPLLESQSWSVVSMIIFSVTLVILLSKSQFSFEKKTILLWCLLPLLLVWFCSIKVPMFLDRYLAHILTAFAILVPIILFSFSKKLAPLALSVISLIFLYSFQIAPSRVLDSPLADKKLKEMKGANTIVIVSPGYQDFMFTHFYDKNIYTNAAAHQADTLGKRIINEQNFAAYKEGIRRALRKENIYIINEIGMFPLSLDSLDDVIHYEFNTAVCYPQNAIKDSLEAEFGPAIQLESFPEGIYLYHYKRQ